MQNERLVRAAEGAVLVLFLAWLPSLPLPFGSVVERARLPLVAIPLALCALASVIRVIQLRADGASMSRSSAWRIWSIGSMLFAAFILLQLVPLPMPLLRAISPASAAIWSGGDRVAALLGKASSSAHPISVDPAETLREWFRIIALIATFQTAALLVRSHVRRMALAFVLIASATFEILYGVNEAASRRYEVWGWKNKLIFNRVTGTFVNPDHFAHYLAIIVPAALFLAAIAWHNSAAGAPIGIRVTRLIEKHLLPFAIGVLGAFGCLAAILVAQSRGALIALFAGVATVTAIAMSRSHMFRSSRRRRVAYALGGLAGSLFVLAALVLYLGRERTIKRFTPNEEETVTLVGRTAAYQAGFGVWRAFPIFGSGAGTFTEVGGIGQRQMFDRYVNHAHNDYLEIAATTGIIGFAIASIALLAGAWALVRVTFGDEIEASFRRRAFHAAGLMSLAIAMIHALVDFNFFIPSNPATLAAIAGAAVAMRLSLDADSTADRVPRHRVRHAHVDAPDAR